MAELNFLSLNDDCIHAIIDACPKPTLKALRCVSRRLQGLVDEHIIDINGSPIPADTVRRILTNCQRYRNVRTFKIDWLHARNVEALLKTRWEHLETFICLGIYDVDAKFRKNAHLMNPSALRTVLHLKLWGGKDLPGTLGAIGSVCPLLQSVTVIHNDYSYSDGYVYSTDFFAALVGSGPADLPCLTKLTLPGSSLTKYPLHDYTSVHWDMIQEIDLSSGPGFRLKGPEGVAALFGPPSHPAHWPNLKVLNLSGCLSELDQFNALFDIHMPKLETLDLSFWKVGPGVGAVLRGCAHLPCLKRLMLADRFLVLDDIRAFMEATLPRLEFIELGLAVGGLAALNSNAHRWPCLTDLRCDALCTKADANSFCSNNFWNLRRVQLCGPPVLLQAPMDQVVGAEPQKHLFRLAKI